MATQKKDKTKVIKTNLLLNEGQKYCIIKESSLQYFWTSLGDNLYWKPIFGLLFELPLKTGFTVCLFLSNHTLSWGIWSHLGRWHNILQQIELDNLVTLRVWLLILGLWVRSQPAPYFGGDLIWSWNIRLFVSYKWKYMHRVLVKRLSLNLPIKSVVNWPTRHEQCCLLGCLTRNQINKHSRLTHFCEGVKYINSRQIIIPAFFFRKKG